MSTEIIPSPEEVSTLSSPNSRSSRRSANEEDVAATRHLRLMISSIAENDSLSTQERQERISNFEKLLEDAEKKLHFNGDTDDDPLLLSSNDKRRGRITISKFEKKEKKTKKSFLVRFRRKSKNTVDEDEGVQSIGRNSELESITEEREGQNEESYAESNYSDEEGNREAAPEEQPGPQPSSVYIPGAPQVVESATQTEEPDDDTRSRTSSILDMRNANSEDYVASICSIRSLGTFERDFINNIIAEDQRTIAGDISISTFEQDAGLTRQISVSTFERDAGMVRGKAGFPTEVGGQIHVDEEDDLTLGSILSETTFEKDARKAAVNSKEMPPVQVEFSNDNAVMMQDDDTLADNLSETTFEQDHKTIATEMASRPDIQLALSEGSLRSVSTFEKDAAARAAVSAKIGREMITKAKNPEEGSSSDESSEGTFVKDQRARGAVSQRSRSSIPTFVQTDSATIYEREAKQKENNQFKSQQIVYCNDDDGKSSFEKDVSRKMASHAVKLVAVPPTPPPVPRINELVVELSPGAVQKQVMQLAKQRSGKKKWFGR
eukprot:scaffold2243_cov73-Cyclotella_meneghiniana.AAC.6